MYNINNIDCKTFTTMKKFVSKQMSAISCEQNYNIDIERNYEDRFAWKNS